MSFEKDFELVMLVFNFKDLLKIKKIINLRSPLVFNFLKKFKKMWSISFIYSSKQRLY